MTFTDGSLNEDSLSLAFGRGVRLDDEVPAAGYGVVEVFGPDGELKQSTSFENRITDAGDLYNASMIIALVGTPNAAQPTKVTGMKVGTGTTAAAKNGAGAALVTYTTAIIANRIFDTTHPQVVNLGAGAGVNAVYKCSWAAGQATSTGLTEVVLVNDAATDATSTAANTVSRAVFASTPKGALDTMTITWNHLQLGT